MKVATVPENEKKRLEALTELEILDTLKEQAYDDLTHLAALICDVPISLVSLVDEDRQWFKSQQGLNTVETHRNFAFCSHAILEDEILYIPDSEKDERFHDNPLVTNPPHVKFYAGIPLTIHGNKKVGTLCVIDNKPRTLTERQLAALKCLARQVESQLELRLMIIRSKILESQQANHLEELAHQLERKVMFERTQEAARIGCWQVDIKTNKCIWSKVTYDIHELDHRTEILVEDGINFYIEEHRPIISKLVEQGITERKGWDVQLKIRTAKDNIRWVRAIGYPIMENESPIRIEGTFQDITEIKTKEDDINRLNQRLTLALEASTVGVWELSIASQQLMWDRQMCALYHIDDKEFEGLFDTWTSKIYFEDRNAFSSSIEVAVKTKTKLNTSFRIHGPTGEFRTIRSLAEAVYDDSGLPIKMVGVNWDITDAVIKENQLTHERLRAVDALKARSAFFANMSHEIRTPLNGIIGFASLILNEDLPKHLIEPMMNIKDCGDGLLGLINDILDISKIEAGKLSLENISVNIDELVKSVLVTFERLIEQKGLNLSYSKEQNVPENINGDPLRLRQILFNLIGNAVKFTDRGGIRVKVRVLKKNREDLTVEFEIADTGIGIPPEAQNNLFTSFQQVDSSTSRIYGGTGLGLSICKNLVDIMGGNISMTSEYLKGTSFKFDIKTIAVAKPIIEKKERLPLNFNPELRILIVDDNQVNLLLMKKLVQKLGYRNFKTAENGLEAVSLAKEYSFDVIFMDIQMPVMDGYEATTRLRGDCCYKEQIIGLSANAFDEDKNKAIKCGMDSYLPKPLKLEILSEALSRITNSLKSA